MALGGLKIEVEWSELDFTPLSSLILRQNWPLCLGLK